MHYSFSSVYMAIIASNVLLILLTLCFQNKKIMVNAGYKILLFFVYCTLLRFLFPFELPVSRNVLMPEAVSYVVSRVHLPLFTVANVDFSIWMLLLMVWGFGFLVQLVRHLEVRRKSNYFILSSCLNISEREPYRSLVEQICRAKGKKNCFEILEVSGITVPMLYGVFAPKILIPENWMVSQQQLYYVLSHEISHHFHRDLVIKNLVNLLAMVYWWNPFCPLLVRQTSIILEMRIDDKIARSDPHTVSDYLQCLIDIAEQSVAAKQKLIPHSLSVSFSKNMEEMTNRFIMLTGSDKKKHYSWNVALVILTLGIYVLSYVYIFEAHYMSDSYKDEVIEQSADNSYAIKKADGTYDIYYNSYFVDNVDSLEYFPGITIYTEEKENNYEEN